MTCRSAILTRSFTFQLLPVLRGSVISWTTLYIRNGHPRLVGGWGPFAADSIRCKQRRVPMTSVNERRRHSRVPVEWPVVIRMKDRTAVGETRNVSARGALIQTERPLHPKEKFRVFMVPANRRAFRVTCEVAWVKGRPSGRRISTYVSGIRFTRLLKGDGQFLLNFIRTQLMPHPEVPRCVANL